MYIGVWVYSYIKYQYICICMLLYILLGTDKSLARPGRKQARKHVKDERHFNNIETRHVIKSPPLPREARRRRKFTPFGRKQYLVSFLVGLRTYQHPCTAYSGHCYIPGFFHVDKAAETWCWPYSYTVCLPTVHRDTFTFHLFVMNCGELPLLFPSVTFHP